MFSPSDSVSVYVCLEPTDMRRSFDRLAGMVQEIVLQNPLSGHLFVFVSKRKNMLKILFWDRTGYCQYEKRLENGTFGIPFSEDEQQRSMCISAEQLRLMLDGIDILSSKKKMQ